MSVTKLAPWFFGLNHIHYARWLSVHVRDMYTLDNTHLDVAVEFQKGKMSWPTHRRSFHSL